MTIEKILQQPNLQPFGPPASLGQNICKVKIKYLQKCKIALFCLGFDSMHSLHCIVHEIKLCSMLH